MTQLEKFRNLPDEEFVEELIDWFIALNCVEWSKENILEILRQEVDCDLK